MPIAEGLQNLLDTSPVRCDEVVWSFLGLSMAAWNGLISTLAALISMILYRRI
ncbi:MAG: disulfide bond formation protein B [Candidatus Puniceispirillaceae bacterium]